MKKGAFNALNNFARQTRSFLSMQELPTPVCLCELVLQPHDLRALLRGDLPQRGVGLLHRGEVLAVLLLRAADQGPLLGQGAVLPGGKKETQ